jgi:hypothetical protein
VRGQRVTFVYYHAHRNGAAVARRHNENEVRAAEVGVLVPANRAPRSPFVTLRDLSAVRPKYEKTPPERGFSEEAHTGFEPVLPP